MSRLKRYENWCKSTCMAIGIHKHKKKWRERECGQQNACVHYMLPKKEKVAKFGEINKLE